MNGRVIQCWWTVSVAALLCQCASGPTLEQKVTLQPTDQVTVRFIQKKGPNMGLRTQGDQSLNEIFSGADRDPTAKVLDTVDFEVLLNLFESAAFSQRATPGVTRSDARSAIEVTINGETRHWLRPDPKESMAALNMLRDYQTAFGYFMNAYNAPRSFYSMNVSSEEVMRRDREKVERAKAKHEALKRNGKQP